MSKIILLNGTSSSGKTSIARSIQYLSNEHWITFGIDTFYAMLPYVLPGRENESFDLVPGENERGPLMTINWKPAFKSANSKFFGAMADFTHMLGSRGYNLIIDEVFINSNDSNKRLKSYVDKLVDHTVYFIGVKCDMAILQEREYLRQDRMIGMSNNQFDRVHTGTREYDLTVDTSNASVFDVAKEIITFIENNSKPNGFNNMRSALE